MKEMLAVFTSRTFRLTFTVFRCLLNIFWTTGGGKGNCREFHNSKAPRGAPSTINMKKLLESVITFSVEGGVKA